MSTAVISDIAFTRDRVVVDVEADGKVASVDLDHEDAVELAAAVILHVALGAIDAGEVVDPADELARVMGAVRARAAKLLAEALPILRDVRDAEQAGAVEREFAVHDGGGEVSEPRAPGLAVVREG